MMLLHVRPLSVLTCHWIEGDWPEAAAENVTELPTSAVCEMGFVVTNGDGSSVTVTSHHGNRPVLEDCSSMYKVHVPDADGFDPGKSVVMYGADGAGDWIELDAQPERLVGA